MVCTILAKAGPQRSRVLANLYKDERTHVLQQFPFMEKVYLERILRSDEVTSCLLYQFCCLRNCRSDDLFFTEKV